MSFPSVHRLGVLALLTLAASCSSSDDSIALLSATQDLTLDPTGHTTVLVYASPVSTGLDTSNFAASGGQTPTGVVVALDTVTIVWDDRVTPSHTVRAVAASGLAGGNRPVVTSDDAVPTFTATGSQAPGVGGDTITVTFTGPNVVEAMAENPANWTLTNSGRDMDLTGSTFVLDEGSQVMTVTLGPVADVFASFDLAPSSNVVSVADVALATAPVTGAATGDTTVPTLVSVVQNLDTGNGGDEFGTVLDLTFSEDMSPAFAVVPTNYGTTFPIFATAASPVTGAPDTIRVTFTGPVVPTIDTVSLNNLVDAHGNPLGNMAGVAVTADGTVAGNAFDSGPDLTTVANVGGDLVEATFDFPLDPEVASEAARWFLESPDGTPVDISGATFAYVESTKTLTVTLANDVLNGDSFEFGAAPGNEPRNIDGSDFVLTATGTVTGELSPPTIASVVQNRTLDTDGLTYDVTFDEDVEETAAETTTNYVFSNGANVTSATLMPAGNLVRVEVDAIAVPGEHTVDVANVPDLAGNAMAPATALALTSTDGVAPSASSPTANAISGADNDYVTVTFDDTMFAAEVTDPSNWTVESPVGNALDTSLASIVFNPVAESATLTFDGGDGIDFQTGDDFLLAFTGMRDIAGNTIDTSSLTGSVDAENDLPVLESVWFENAPNNNLLHLRFSEACTNFDDIPSTLTRYVVRDAIGTNLGGGTPIVALDSDGRGATLTYGLGMVAGYTLDVRGITDLAGNQMVPVEAFPMVAASSSEPALSAGTPPEHLSVSGEANDSLVVTFDEPVSSFGLFDPANWDLTNGPNSADFSLANFSFDGVDTVTIDFDVPGGFSFDQAAHTLTVDGLWSAQGVEMTGPSALATVVAGGSDVTAAGASNTRLDAVTPATDVLVEFDEAVLELDAEVLGNYLLNGATAPDSADWLGFRTVRLSFSGGVTTLDTIDVTVEDLAGNAALATHAIASQDSGGPVLSSVSGVAVAGAGGDRLQLVYTGPVAPTSGLDLSNYSVTEAGLPVPLTGATATWDSTSLTVTIVLGDGVDLTTGSLINVQASGVLNHAGIVMSPNADVNGVVGGDSTAPDFATSFVNFREALGGTSVDLYLDEDADQVFLATPSSYTVSGGQNVTAVEVLDGDHVRLTLDAALVDGDTVSVTGLSDLAGNASAAIVTQPLF